MLAFRQKYLPLSLLHWKNERDSQTNPEPQSGPRLNIQPTHETTPTTMRFLTALLTLIKFSLIAVAHLLAIPFVLVLPFFAGYASRGRALRPVIGPIHLVIGPDGEQRKLQPDPAPDISKSQAWYVESTKKFGGRPYSCSFVEFDERGDYLDFHQHLHAYEKIRELAKKLAESGERLAIVIFVHGWRNNCQSGNVAGFNNFLSQLAQSPYIQERACRVHGIYIGWRGTPVRHSLSSAAADYRKTTADFGEPIVDLKYAARFPRLSNIIETFTYWNRKNIAEEKFGGTSLSRTLFTCAHTAKSYGGGDANRVFLIGHSFGALLLERTFQNATIGELIKEWTWDDPARALTAKANPLPFDTVLLVNSAAPSIYAKQFQSYLAAHRGAMARGHITGANAPIFYSLTSTGDWATGKMHRLGNCLAGLEPTLWHDYHGSEFILARAEGQPDPAIPQAYYYKRTPGHNPLLINRFIEPDPGQGPLPRAVNLFQANLDHTRHDTQSALHFQTSSRLDNGEAKSWCINFPPETTTNATWSSYDGRRPVAWDEPARESAYWLLRCPAEIIHDHNDIWNKQAMETYAALYRAAEVLRTQPT
jgi:hypothetical protein